MAILKQIDGVFFRSMEEFMHQEIGRFYRMDVPLDQIQIYIPEYLLKMYGHWQGQHYGYEPDYSDEAKRRFREIKILDNYDNTVVVSFKDIHYRHDLKPAILPVFGNS